MQGGPSAERAHRSECHLTKGGATSAYHLAKGWATKDGQPERCESEAQVQKLRGPGKGFCTFVSPPRPPPFVETSACHSVLLKAAEGISRSHLLFRHDTGKFRQAGPAKDGIFRGERAAIGHLSNGYDNLHKG